MSRERRGAWGLLTRQAATDLPLAVIVAAVVAVGALLVTVVPGALAQVADRELRHTLTEYSALRHDLTASAPFSYPSGRAEVTSDPERDFTAITTTVEGVGHGLSEPLASILGAPQWAAMSSREFATVRDDPDRVAAPVLGLVAAPQWRELIAMVEGVAPAPAAAAESAEGEPTSPAPVDIALSVTAARQVGLVVGDVIDTDTATYAVSGLYEPADPGDPFWGHLSLLQSPAPGRGDDGRPSYSLDALIAPASTADLPQRFNVARLEAWYPVLIDEVAFADLPVIAEQIRQLSSQGILLPSNETLLFTPRLASDLDQVTARVAVTTALLALLLAGPLGVMLAVLALAAGSIADRRSTALALARARGASGLQLRTAMMLEGAVLAVPAAALGAAAAFAATGGRTTMLDLWPAVLVAATPPLLFALAVPAAADRPRRWTSIRWVIEVLVTGLAAASVFLLFRRGVAPAGAGIDPLLAAAPLLIAAAVTVGALRAYPWLMAAAQRAAGRGRGAVSLVGSAHAVRAPSLGFAAAFALIVGVSIAVFSAGMAASLADALAAEPAAGVDAPALSAGHPLVVAMFAVLAAAAALPLLFCIVAIVLAVIAAARTRSRTVGVLRVLGFSAGQVRGLVAWEVVPVVVVAIVAGVALGVAEVFVLGAALDLPSVVGARSSPPARVDAPVTAAIALAFAAATALAAAIATRVARRRSPGSRIRMGTE